MKIIAAKAALAIVVMLFGAVIVSGADVSAQANQIQEGVNSIGGGTAKPLMQSVKTLINVFLFLIGAVAVVMIIFGGFKYVTSSGESSAVSSAKNTILYAVVGLVVAVLAYAIVNFVLGSLNTPATNTGQAAGETSKDAAEGAIDKAKTPATGTGGGGGSAQ